MINMNTLTNSSGVKVFAGWIEVVWVGTSAGQAVVAKDSNPIRVIKLGRNQCNMFNRIGFVNVLLEAMNGGVMAGWLGSFI